MRGLGEGHAQDLRVPEVSRFYGIVISLYYDEHLPPHFHARYGEARATLSFRGTLLAGAMPPRAAALVRAWAQLHVDELDLDWELARAGRPLLPIAPLD
jgi:hypothetical protein